MSTKRIPIRAARQVAQEFGQRQVVMVTWDGETTHVVTYGKTATDCDQAVQGGNFVKKALGWPENMCRDRAKPRTCENCVYFKPDYGAWCVNGWSGDGSMGKCLVEPTTSRVGKDHGCHMFELKEP